MSPVNRLFPELFFCHHISGADVPVHTHHASGSDSYSDRAGSSIYQNVPSFPERNAGQHRFQSYAQQSCASVYEDYPIPSEYKLNLPLNVKSVAEKVHYNIEYYDKALLDMQVMKNKCLNENNVFETQVKNLFG